MGRPIAVDFPALTQVWEAAGPPVRRQVAPTVDGRIERTERGGTRECSTFSRSSKSADSIRSAWIANMTKTAIVVLGSPNDDEGNLSSIAIERCEQALHEYRRVSGAKILPTGGWGAHFNTTNKPHGYYIREYLLKKGVPEKDILECAESTNTTEDPLCSKPIVERNHVDELIVVTSDFHVPRARFLFKRVFPKIIMSFSGAETDLDAGDLSRRQKHEEKALERLKQLNADYWRIRAKV